MIGFELIAVFFLILLNGFLAMSEIALAASKKTRIQHMAESGDVFAKKVFKLIEHPNTFLSTIQVGITFIGILTGMVSAATLIQSLQGFLLGFPLMAQYAQLIASGFVLFCITFLMILFGELIPKRIALANPEGISKLVVYPVNLIRRITSPVVWLLSFFTDFFSKLFFQNQQKPLEVSEEEIRSMIRIGVQEGSLKELEMDLLNKVFHLDDMTVMSYLTPKHEVIWIDPGKPWQEIKKTIFNHPHKAYPVAHQSLNRFEGIVYTKKVMRLLADNDEIDMKKLIDEPLVIPETLNLAELILKFQQHQTHFAVVIDEFGNITGIITMNEISEALLGEISEIPGEKEKNIIKREDGTYFVEASVSFEEFTAFFNIKTELPSSQKNFHTLGGFVLNYLRRMPEVSEKFTWNGLEIEIADLDGRRIDKLIVKRVQDKPAGETDE